MTTPLDGFLRVAGYGLRLSERPLGEAHFDRLTPGQIAELLCGGDRESVRDAGADVVKAARALEAACASGVLPAHRGRMETVKARAENLPDGEARYWVHRDHARRYFAALDVELDPGSPLARWLRGRVAPAVKAPRPDQQDKADFQQLAQEYWKRNPTTTITGPGGVAAKVAGAYGRLYKAKTLEAWARDVAPEGVRGRPGRRRKISVETTK